MIWRLNYEFKTKVIEMLCSLNGVLSALFKFCSFFVYVLKTNPKLFRYLLSYFYRYVITAPAYSHVFAEISTSNWDDGLSKNGRLNQNTVLSAGDSKGSCGGFRTHENYINELIFK